MTTPPFDDNPFRSPGYAQPAPMPPVPGHQPVPHWFTTKVRITLVACVVAALGLGALGAMGVSWIARSGAPSSGDCLYLTREGAGKLAYHRVGCSTDNATYKVENSYRGTSRCSSNGYVRFQTTTDSGAGRTLCLALNVRTGDCLRDVEDEVTIAKVSCSDPAATERAEVITGYRGGEGCEEADEVLVYNGPPARVVCLRPPGENI
ncbi:hypothetical protein [Amycolatopsis sp. lyj-346]|uniref:LppU/SCO3897 family protein n=1 Tax=Amycolatopsis sp. lyj-346 TaxID=2789289 RepID=UPI00397C9FA8